MKQHKNKIIAGVIIVAALAVSLFWGGGLGAGSRTGDPGQPPASGILTVSGTSPAQTSTANQKPDDAGDSGNGKGSPGVLTSPDVLVTAGETEKPGAVTTTTPVQESPAQNVQPSQTPAAPDNTQPPVSGTSQPQTTDNPLVTSTTPADNTDRDLTVKLTISCATILNNMDKLIAGKEGLIPPGGIIFSGEVVFYEGESVFNVLLRELKKNKIHMEFVNVPIYNSAYIEGINNIYEFDAGERSGWMYSVNGLFPNYGSSRYLLQDGDEIMWLFTCDRGADIGGGDASDSYNFG